MASPLENLSGPGKPLRKEPPDEQEYSGLKRSALARLEDSAKNSNSLESRFDLAYNAAHALCLAAGEVRIPSIVDSVSGRQRRPTPIPLRCSRKVPVATICPLSSPAFMVGVGDPAMDVDRE